MTSVEMLCACRQHVWPVLDSDSRSVTESDTDQGAYVFLSRYFPPVGTATGHKRDLHITDLNTIRVRVLPRKESRAKG